MTTTKVLKTITVGELIALLQDENPDAQVAFATDYGDHCHTKQVHSIRGEINPESLYESAYSVSGLAVEKEPEDADPNAEVVLIIS